MSRGLGDVYKRQIAFFLLCIICSAQSRHWSAPIFKFSISLNVITFIFIQPLPIIHFYSKYIQNSSCGHSIQNKEILYLPTIKNLLLYASEPTTNILRFSQSNFYTFLYPLHDALLVCLTPKKFSSK